MRNKHLFPALTVAGRKQQEQWRAVPEWEGLYEVSNHGRVRSLNRKVPHWRGGWARRPGRVMALSIDRYGYEYVGLSNLETRKAEKVHRLVAKAFIGPPPEGKPLVLHRNGVPTDNRVENLYWGDQFDNERDKLQHGRHPHASKTHCMKGHPYSDENTYVPPGTTYRQCKKCRAVQTARANRRRANHRRRGTSAASVAALLALGIASAPAMLGHEASASANTPAFTLSASGIELRDPILANDHINVRDTSGKTVGLHIDPNNGHPGGQWIGQNFIPWAAWGIEAGTCLEWIQFYVHGKPSYFNQDGSSEPWCIPEPTPEPDPEPEPEEPGDETPDVPEVEEPETPEVETPETPEVPEVATPEAPGREPTTGQVVTEKTTTIPTGGAIPIKAEPVTVG